MANAYSEQFILELFTAEHDVESDDLVIALMDSGFTFDPETDAVWSDVSADEITSAGGYASQSLTSVAVSIDSGVIKIDCDSPVFTAVGDNFDGAIAAVVYNNTHASKTIVLALIFGATYTTAEDTNFLISTTNGLAKATPVV